MDEATKLVTEAYKHRQNLLIFAQSLSRSRADAEDIVQDVWVRVWRYWYTYQPTASLQSWLYRIAARVWYDLYRRRLKESANLTLWGPDLCARIADSVTQPEDFADSYSAEVRETLSRLSAEHRQILELIIDDNFDGYAEIATALGVKIGTVLSRVHRARGAYRRISGAVLGSPNGKSKKRTLDQRTIRQPSR